MTKTPKRLPDGSGIDPESLDVGTVVEWDGQVNRPPSQAVIAAVEQAFDRHDFTVPAGSGLHVCKAGDFEGHASDYWDHTVAEVAKAAMDAARPIILREAADRMTRDYGNGNSARFLNQWADEEQT